MFILFTSDLYPTDARNIIAATKLGQDLQSAGTIQIQIWFLRCQLKTVTNIDNIGKTSRSFSGNEGLVSRSVLGAEMSFIYHNLIFHEMRPVAYFESFIAINIRRPLESGQVIANPGGTYPACRNILVNLAASVVGPVTWGLFFFCSNRVWQVLIFFSLSGTFDVVDKLLDICRTNYTWVKKGMLHMQESRRLVCTQADASVVRKYRSPV